MNLLMVLECPHCGTHEIVEVKEGTVQFYCYGCDKDIENPVIKLVLSREEAEAKGYDLSELAKG